MPISLPSSLDPQSVSWTRNRPRSIAQSDFTGFTQQILSGTSFLSGEITLPPLNAEQVRDWSSFFGRLETRNADGTFWVPIWTQDYDPDDATGVNWENISLQGLDLQARRIRVENPSDAIKAMGTQIGRQFQVRDRSHADAVFIYTLINYELLPGPPETALLYYSEVHPFFTGGTNFALNTGNKVQARALLPDPASQSLVMDAVTKSVVAPVTIPWTEAVGANLHELRA